jgi:imidazolonepropionase
LKTLITNISSIFGIGHPQKPLSGKALSEMVSLQNAFLLIEEGFIADYGEMRDCPAHNDAESIDARGGSVLPAWCDSHSHLVFAATREEEFVDKIKGLTYAEIAQKGGGINSSVKALRNISEDELYELSLSRLNEAAKTGTGAMEIKSGYGLDTANELKMLRVIRRLRENSKLVIKSTFLGAHTFPPEFREKRQSYIDLIKQEMIPAIAAEGLADFIDVFCEKGFFSPDETTDICKAGIQYGMKPKIHANQLNASGGVQAGIGVNALSVDHLETMDEEAIRALQDSETIGTLLPTAAFFLRMNYQPARTLIDRGCSIALASDFNPGSSPGYNMNFVVSLACIQMKMTPEEAINAATINGAFAMDVADITGSIAKGKLANFILTKPVRTLAAIPYHFSNNNINNVMVKGQWLM